MLNATNIAPMSGAGYPVHVRGLKISHEIAITGFDCIESSKHTSPPLTTLDIPICEKLQKSFRTRLAILNGEILLKRNNALPSKFLTRHSIGA